MTKQTQIIVTSILSVVLVAASIDSYLRIKKKQKVAKKTPEQVAQELKDKGAKPSGGATPPPSQPAAPAAGTEKPAPAARVSRDSQKAANVEEQVKITESEWGRNPFFEEPGSQQKPPDGKDPDKVPVDVNVPVQPLAEDVLASMKLDGISIISGDYIAVINRKILRVGDSFSTEKGTFKIQDIKKDRVLLEANGGMYELSLKK